MSADSQFDTGYVRRNVARLAARGGIVLVAGQSAQLLLSIFTTIVLARLLGPEDFGLIAMVAPFVAFLAFFRDSGLQIATVQRETIDHRQVSTLFWFNVGLGFCLMVLLALLSPLVARFFAREELRSICFAYALNILIGGASVQHSALLARRMAFGRVTAAAIVSQVIGLAVAILGALAGLGPWALVAMALSTTLAQTILSWCFSGWLPGLPRRGTGVRKMLAFGGGLTVSNLFNQATQYVDVLLIGRILGAVPLGYYDRARQLFVMPLFQIMGPLASVAIPALSRLVDAPDRYAKAYLRIQEKLVITTTLFSAFLVVYGDAVIALVLGPRWAAVGPVLQAFAVGGVIVPVSSSVAWLLVTQARSLDLAYWSPFSLMLRCAAIACGYPWGIFGIAASIASFQYLSFAAFSMWAGRKGPVTAAMVVRNMAPALIAGAISCAAAWPIKGSLGGLSAAAALGVGAFTFAATFLLVLGLMPSGRAALLDMWHVFREALARRRTADDR